MPVVSGSRPGILQSLIGLKTGSIRKGHNTEMLALKRNQISPACQLLIP